MASRADFSLEPAKESLGDGRKVIIKRFSAMERAEYQAKCAEANKATKDKPDGERLMAYKVLEGDLVARALLCDDGSPMFESGEDAVRSMQEHDLDEVTQLIARVNRMGSADPKA